MEQDYIKHEYAKGVWYEAVRKCPRTARQRQQDAMYEQMMQQMQTLQNPYSAHNAYKARLSFTKRLTAKDPI